MEKNPPTRSFEPPSSNRRSTILTGLVLIALLAAIPLTDWLYSYHNHVLASQDSTLDTQAIDRVTSRHLFPSPTPQVVQVEDPALVTQIQDLTKEVQGLR